MRLLFIALVTIFISGCIPEQNQQLLVLDTTYRRDIQISVGDMDFDGVAVLPAQDSYEFTFRLPGKASFISVRNCHRDWSAQEAWSSMWNSKKVEYVFKPTIDEKISCPVVVESFDLADENHSWGYIDFEDPKYTLTAALQCNGFMSTPTGVSVCQGRSNTIQFITFPETAQPSKDSKCFDKIKTVDNSHFEVTVQEGFCPIVFKSASGKMHRLTIVGYSSILVRRN